MCVHVGVGSGIVAVLLASLAGCRPTSNASQVAKGNAADAGPPKVSVVQPARTTVRLSINRPGYNIEAYQRTAMYARISGYIGKWHVDIGATVHKDAVLAELWVPEMEVELQQKEAAATQAEAEIRQAGAAVTRAKAELAFRKSQYDRFVGVAQNLLTKENVDEARYSLDAGQASLAKAEADVAVAQAKLEVAKKSRDYTKEMLGYAKILAPFEGVVTERNVNDRDFVQPASGKKAEPLFVVEQLDPVRVFVHVPEQEAVWIEDGDSAVVRIPSRPDREYKGKVTRNSRALNPTTRTLKIEIDLANPKKELLPGMYANITLLAERRDVWALPASAVVVEEEKRYCYRLEGDKAVRTPLKIGLRGDKLVEVLKQQVQPHGAWEDFTGKEAIIASGVAGLTDGQPVRVSADTK
jgi:RND family efflux transporter MFP subunit